MHQVVKREKYQSSLKRTCKLIIICDTNIWSILYGYLVVRFNLNKVINVYEKMLITFNKYSTTLL